MGKSPLTSKTLWVNLLAIAGLVIQTQTGYVIPPEGQAALLGLGNLVLRLITRQAIDWKQVKLPGSGAMAFLFLAGGLALLPLLSGCGALRIVEERPVLTELAVRVATARVLAEHPTWTDDARDISGAAIRTLDESEQVDLGVLEQTVLELVPWSALMPEEQELVTVLIRAVRMEIEAELQRQGITAPQEVRVRVAAVLGWIYQVADARLQRSAAASPAVQYTSAPGAQGWVGAVCEAEATGRAARTDRARPGYFLTDAQLTAAIDEAAARADAVFGL